MKLSPIKLPFQIELILSLISEDIKKRKFLSGLHSIDLKPNQWLEQNLGRLVLKAIGFAPINDELLLFYVDLIHQHSDPTFTLEKDELDEVYKVYALLIKRKREMSL